MAPAAKYKGRDSFFYRVATNPDTTVPVCYLPCHRCPTSFVWKVGLLGVVDIYRRYVDVTWA